MSVWGKVVGGAAGLALGGPIGALIGAAAGHAVDRFRGDLEPDATKRIGFTVGVIVLGAKMAKADGAVTRHEIAAFRRVFRIPEGEERNVARLFDRARRDSRGFEPYARQLARMLADRPAVLLELLDCLFAIAEADGRLHPDEIAWLEAVARILGIGEADFARLLAVHGGPAGDDPHAVLGVDRDVDAETLRRRYRELVRAHHPDRLIAEGVPPELVAVATRRMGAINAAYDALARAPGAA